MKDLKQFLTGFQKGMEEFGNNLFLIVNTVLLSLVYLIGIGLTSLLAKMVGKHFLEKKMSKEKKSYWTELELKKKPIEEYYRQF